MIQKPFFMEIMILAVWAIFGKRGMHKSSSMSIPDYTELRKKPW
jgi:hypothetical protein